MADFVQTSRDLSLESSAEEKFRLAVEVPSPAPQLEIYSVLVHWIQ